MHFSRSGCSPETNIKSCAKTDLDPESYMTSRILILLTAVLLAGCQTVKEITGLGPEAKTRVGQLQYNYGDRSIVGDIILRSLKGGDYDLYFSKAGVTVLEFQTRGSHMAATGML